MVQSEIGKGSTISFTVELDGSRYQMHLPAIPTLTASHKLMELTNKYSNRTVSE